MTHAPGTVRNTFIAAVSADKRIFPDRIAMHGNVYIEMMRDPDIYMQDHKGDEPRPFLGTPVVIDHTLPPGEWQFMQRCKCSVSYGVFKVPDDLRIDNRTNRCADCDGKGFVIVHKGNINDHD